MTAMPVPSDLERQVKISRLVSFGFGITLADQSGFAAPFAVAFGLHALILIKSSDKPFTGKIMAWWCIVVGGYNGIVGTLRLLYLLANFYQR